MTELSRKFQGVWIPANLWLNRELSITEKVMLVEIGSLQDDERGCYASNAHFAGFFDLSVSRVSEIISGLSSKGLIEVEQIRDGKRIVERRIRLSTPFGKPNTPSEKAMNPFGKGDEPPSEKAKGSNTRESNTENNTSLGDQAFEAAWKAYPKREGANPKNKAYSAWKARLKEGVTQEAMLAGVIRYHAYCSAKGNTGTEYVMQAQRFFGKGREFENEWASAAPKQSRHHGFDQRDYYDGLTQREDGTHAF